MSNLNVGPLPTIFLISWEDTKISKKKWSGIEKPEEILEVFLSFFFKGKFIVYIIF